MSQETNHIDETIAALEVWRERIGTAIETLMYLRAQGPGLPAAPLPSAARVALSAISLRRSGESTCARTLAPIFPPLRPIAAMTREISDFVTFEALSISVTFAGF